MNEFNPFDDLGITLDNSNDNRRDRQYTNPFDNTEKFTVDPGNQPDFVLNDSKQDIGDWEVRNELGIDLDNSLEDLNVAQEYVNGLSDKDYQTWRKLRDEGYSVNATKTLMDNQDLLYDINQEGRNKYLSTNRGGIRNLYNSLLQTAGEANRIYEDIIHPWTDEMKYNLDQKTMDIINETSREDEYLKYLGTGFGSENMPSNLPMYLSSVDANVKMQLQGIKALLPQIAKAGPAVIDFLTNFGTQLGSLINPSSEKAALYGYDVATIDPSKRSTIRGSYESLVNSVFLPAFIAKYPSASLVLTELAATSPSVDEIMEKLMSGTENFYRWLLEKTHVDRYFFEGLNEQEQQEAINNLAQGTWIVATAIIDGLKTKVRNSEPVRDFETALKVSNEFSKRYTQSEMNKVGKSREEALKGQEVGTELLNEKGKPIATQTEEGVKPTVGGMINLGKTKLGKRVQGFKNSMEWYYKYLKDKSWLVDRDPNAPVGELPVVPVTEEKTPGEEKPTEEIIPKEEVKIEDLKETPKPNLRKAAPRVETSQGTMGEGISSFVKRVTNSLAGTEGGLTQEMITKLQNSPQLQNEYVNTIDPYLRSNGAENPAGVIKDQLADFVQTAKDQLEVRRNNNMEFRKGQMKYRVEIPEYEKAQWKTDDLELKNLIKILSKSQDNPEQFLKYLLNLPKEQVQIFEKYIPDFTQNLGIIQDTLELTKAITKPDIVDKFLSYKSSWGSRRKGFVRKMIYEYLKNKYKEMGVQYNMKEVERILNNMSEDELVQLESEVNKGDIRPYMSDAEFTDLLDKGYTPGTWVPANQNINEIMDSKRPGTNKTTREYLKEKGVQLSLTNERGLQKIGGNIQAAYSAKLDRILMKSENNPYKGIIYHEFGHRVLAQLGTTQIMDIITHIAERDGITQDAAFERRAEYFRNYLQYNNVDGKKYLVKNLGKDIASKINATMEKTKEEIWDLFDLDEGDKNINQIISDVKHDTPEGKDITSRRPEPIVNDMVPQSSPVRYEYLRTIDPNIDSVEVYPYFDKPIQIKFKDGSTQRWTEYRKTLTPEQLKEIDTYETDIVREFVDEQIGRNKGFKGEGNFNYDTLENEKNLTDILMDQSLKSFQQTKESLGLDAFETAGYLKSLKNIDPDIVGLTEKNGKLCVQVLFESYRERYELPDRPGMVEMKTIPIDEFFVLPEDIKQLPEDLQKLIKKDAD